MDDVIWTEIGEQVFAKRFNPVDVTVTAVIGGDGVLVVDTRCDVAQGREIREQLARITPLPVRWVVNTHAHWDHVWGNSAFDIPELVPPAEFWGHERCPEAVEDREGDSESPGFVARPPDRLVGVFHQLDLGDRIVELHHLGRGHTDADLALWLPDIDVLIAGDIIEESGPPAYGSDSFPMDWPGTLEALAQLTEGDATYVPGHGAAVQHAFVSAQHEYARAVRDQISELYHNGVPAAAALEAGTWPHPATEAFKQAVMRGYAQLSGELP